MNREIKFRGKDILHKSWQYGSLAKDEPQKSYYIIDNEYGRGINVDKETVGQYTGLHDKNGKEIYEGDIIRIKNSLIEIEGEVIFDTIDLSFEVYDKENDCKEMLLYTNKEFEVIGNEYDNPELLGGR